MTRGTKELVEAIRLGQNETLGLLLQAHPGLVSAGAPDRSALHHATDWPGHWPNVQQTISQLIAAGANPNARFPHETDPEVAETPLHWAASSGDVAAIDALLDGGAEIDPAGGIIGGCTPLEEAIIFEHYPAATRLLERGAAGYLPGAAALNQMDLATNYFDTEGRVRNDIGLLPHWKSIPDGQLLLDRAFQFACRAGHVDMAKFLLAKGADRASRTPNNTTGLDEARKNGHQDVLAWLLDLG